MAKKIEERVFEVGPNGTASEKKDLEEERIFEVGPNGTASEKKSFKVDPKIMVWLKRGQKEYPDEFAPNEVKNGFVLSKFNIMKEIEKKTELGKRLYSAAEREYNKEESIFKTDPIVMALIKKQMNKYEDPDQIIMVGGYEKISPKRFLEEIENKTELGKRFYNSAEKLYHEFWEKD